MQRSQLLRLLTVLWLSFLLALSFGAPGSYVAFADCVVVPNPTLTPQPTYHGNILNTESAHLVAYWPLDDLSGSTVTDRSGHGYSGLYSGATLNATTFLDGNPAPGFDGINDWANIYSSGLASAFNGSQGTLLVWAKVRDASVWSNGALNYPAEFVVNSTNRILVRKNTDGSLLLDYIAGGVAKAATLSTSSHGSPTSWMQFIITWDHAGDTVRLFFNGAQSGVDQTGLGSWSGSLDSTQTIIGAAGTTNAGAWNGYIADVALWDTALSISEATTLYSIPTVLPTETPVPTCTPTPTYTWTPSPTWTPTPTNTPTNTPSPTATANTIVFWTLPPGPSGTALPNATGTPTPVPGRDVGFDYTITAGGVAIDLLLMAIFVTILVIVAVAWIRERRNASED